MINQVFPFTRTRALATLLLLGGTTISIGCKSDGVVVRQPGESTEISSRDIDTQDFDVAAKQLAEQMLTAPRISAALKPDADGRLPLIYLSEIRNSSGTKVNLVDWFVNPIESVLVESNKVDFLSADEGAKELRGGFVQMGQNQPRLPTYTVQGFVSRLQTFGDKRVNVYKFAIKVTRNADGVLVFSGERKISKEF